EHAPLHHELLRGRGERLLELRGRQRSSLPAQVHPQVELPRTLVTELLAVDDGQRLLDHDPGHRVHDAAPVLAVDRQDELPSRLWRGWMHISHEERVYVPAGHRPRAAEALHQRVKDNGPHRRDLRCGPPYALPWWPVSPSGCRRSQDAPRATPR